MMGGNVRFGFGMAARRRGRADWLAGEGHRFVARRATRVCARAVALREVERGVGLTDAPRPCEAAHSKRGIERRLRGVPFF